MVYMIYKIRSLRCSFLILCALFAVNGNFAQITVPNYTQCPNENMTITATWNNVSNITFTLNPGNIIQSSPIFPINAPTVTTNYTIAGVGTTLAGPVTSSFVFNVFVQPPPPLVIGNVQDYCHGATGTFVVTNPVPGASFYNVTGPPGTASASSNNNVIQIPNMTAVPNTGTYTITTTVSGCTYTGTTGANIAPNHQLTVSSPSNVCLGGFVGLNAAMPTATSLTWFGPNSYNAFLQPPQPVAVTCTNISQQGTYTVTADIIFGTAVCPRTATTQITIVETSPVVANASPSKTLCQGANLNLSAGVTSGVPQGYTWQGPQNYNSSLQNPVLTSVVQNFSGNYTVTALFFNSAITCTTTSTVSITIIPTSQPLVTATSNTCQGEQISLTANAPGASTYSWSGPAGFTSMVQTPPAIQPAQPNNSGTYFVYATFNGGTAVNCVTSKSVQVNVVPINSISVVPPAQVCQPNNAYLQANAIGATSYAWTGPNGYGPIPSANATVYYPTLASSGIYTVTAYFTSGITCSNVATTSLTINPLLNFTLVPRQQTCYNTPVTINGPAGATSYTWTSSNGFTSNSQNVNIPSAQPNQSGTYTLNVSLGPCVTTGTSDVLVLTPLQFTLVPLDREICRGDAILLQGGATGGSENYAYTWNPSVYLSSNNGSVQTGNPLGTTIYNLIVYDIACPNYTIAHSFSVNVKQPPQPNLKLNKTEGCTPFCMVYDANTDSTAFNTTYDFGGSMQIQNDTALYHCLTAPGTYSLKINTVGKNGCSGSYSYPVPIVVHPKPGTTMVLEPETPTVTDLITFSSSNNVEPISYTWLVSNPGITGYDTTSRASFQINYENAGIYPIILITKTDKECSDTVTKYVEVKDNYNVYIPNTFTPNGDGLNDVFLLKGSGFKLEDFRMEIFDRWGVLVYSTEDVTKGWDGTVKGQTAKDGIYIYSINLIGSNGEGRENYTGYVTLYK